MSPSNAIDDLQYLPILWVLCMSNSGSNSYPKNSFLLPPHTAAAGAKDLSTHMGPIAVVEFELATSLH